MDACLASAMGIVRATGRGVSRPAESTALLALVEGDVGARFRIAGPVWLRATAGVAWGHRPEDWHFDVTAGAPVQAFQPWPVAILATLGVAVDVLPVLSENGSSPRLP